jgi:hypothetical protein
MIQRTSGRLKHNYGFKSSLDFTIGSDIAAHYPWLESIEFSYLGGWNEAPGHGFIAGIKLECCRHLRVALYRNEHI